MTSAEAAALLDASRPCVRFTRRPDGRIVTADAPCEPPSSMRLVRALVVLASGSIATSLAVDGASIEPPRHERLAGTFTRTEEHPAWREPRKTDAAHRLWSEVISIGAQDDERAAMGVPW